MRVRRTRTLSLLLALLLSFVACGDGGSGTIGGSGTTGGTATPEPDGGRADAALAELDGSGTSHAPSDAAPSAETGSLSDGSVAADATPRHDAASEAAAPFADGASDGSAPDATEPGTAFDPNVATP